MSANTENPYAFPHGNPTHGGDIGMTLRDYFAGQALAGLVANPQDWLMYLDYEPLATNSYAIADVMLKERSK